MHAPAPCCAALGLIMLGASTASGEETGLVVANARLALVFTETADGVAQTRSQIEADVARRLLERGVDLVDEEQSRAIRSRLADGSLVPALEAEAIDGFDADIIVHASVVLTAVASDHLPDAVHRYDALVEAQVLRVDTARVLAAFTVMEGALGATPAAARANAVRSAAKVLDAKIDALIRERDAAIYELFVAGVPNVQAGARLRRAIAALPHVMTIAALTEDPAQSRFALRTTHPSAQELAEMLGRRDLPLDVYGYTHHAVRARFDLRIRDAQSAPLSFYDPNTIDWSDPDSVAAFVTVSAPALEAVSSRIRRDVPAARLRHPLGAAASVHAVLAALGVRYAPDPASPFGQAHFDHVQFAAETLVRRAGDCDDLAVVGAAIAQALGARSLLLIFPHHVLLAVGTGLPIGSRHRVPDELVPRLIRHDGELFVPLELTHPDVSFEAATKLGFDVWARWRSRRSDVSMVDVRAAWVDHPEAKLPFPEPDLPEVAAAADRIAKELEELDDVYERARSAELERLRPATTTDALLAAARLLVDLGRYDEAEASLGRIAPDGTPAHRVDAARGNVALVRDRPVEALEHFERALEHAPPPARAALHVSAALAALVAGDEAKLGSHVLEAQRLGDHDGVLAVSRTGRLRSSSSGKGSTPLTVEAVVPQLEWLVSDPR